MQFLEGEPMPRKTVKDDLPEKIRKCLRAKESGKRGYARADRLLDEISKELVPGEPVLLTESGKKAVLVDQFEDKPIVWKPCGVRRFELKIFEA